MPYVILVPSYGHSGFCWEAFEKRKKHFSRGRIGVPMYSHNLQRSIIEALAHYRWDLAKEMNSLRWMEEGLTGQYYQYYLDEKLKGDVRNYFMEDYILWITKESNGIQKLDKRIRDIFWRYIPFSAERKEDLKLRSSIYQRLYQLDINRSLSNGY
jgi:hypothetical protein